MDFFNGKKKLFNLFNIVDLFIIVFVLVAIIGVYTFLNATIAKSDNTVKTYNITMEIEKAQKYLLDAIKVDKVVYDTVENKKFGTITDVRTNEVIEFNPSEITGEITKTVVPDVVNIEIDIDVNTKEEIYIGKNIGIKNKDFTGAGYIIDMKISEK